MSPAVLAETAATDAAGIAEASSTPAVVVVDDDRRCVESNSAACELLGRSRGRILGLRFDDLVIPAMRDRLEHFWRAFASEGGHAGPFATATGVEVELAVTRNVIAGRHLLMLSPVNSRARRRRFAPLAEAPSPADGRHSRGGGRRPSPRECEVLRLLASGATDPQIAAVLGLSPATVQTHVRNAKSKLGARTRAQAVALGIARGLITPVA